MTSHSTQGSKARFALPAIFFGLGAFLITLALMLVFVVVPNQKVTPLELDSLTLTEPAPANLLVGANFASGEPTPGNAERDECRPPAPEPEGEGEEGAEGEAAEGEEGAPAEDAPLPMSCFIESGVPTVAQRQVYSVEPGGKDDVTFQASQMVLRQDRLEDGDEEGALIQATKDRVTMDRKTAEPIEDNNGSTELVNPETSGEAAEEYHRDGLQYKWPFDPKQEDYDYFDVSTFTTNPIHFVEESEVDGVPVNVYRQEVGPINMYDSIAAHFQETNPGFSEVANSVLSSYRIKGTAGAWGLDGDPNREVRMNRFYTNERTISVSKSTGQILNGREEQFQFFAEDQGAADEFFGNKAAVEQEKQQPTRTAIAFVAAWDQPTIDRAVERSQHSDARVTLYGRTLPIALGIIGILFLIGGAFVTRRRA